MYFTEYKTTIAHWLIKIYLNHKYIAHSKALDRKWFLYVHCTTGNKFKEDWLLQEVIRKLGENYLIQNSNYFELSGRIACSKFDRKIIKCNWRVGVDYFPP